MSADFIEEVQQMELNKWQTKKYDEVWELSTGKKIIIARYENGDISSMSSDSNEEDFEFPDADNVEKLKDLGWTFVNMIKESIIELMPQETVYSLADKIVEMAPLLNKIEIKGMIKRLVHIEKHSVYDRIHSYFKNELNDHSKEFLELKIKTHLEMSRLSNEELGK